MTKTTKTAAKKTTTTRKGKANVRSAAEKANGDIIKQSSAISDNNQEQHLVLSNDGRQLIIPTVRWAGDIRELSAVGGSMDKLEAAWAKANTAKLANGISGRDAPHAAKSIADNKAKQSKAAPKAPAKGKAKPAKAKVAKADASADRAYTVNKKALADKPTREGTWTHVMVETIMAHTSTAKAQAAMDKARGEFKGRKLDFKWAADSRGYITFK